MPYADKEKQLQAQRDWYKNKPIEWKKEQIARQREWRNSLNDYANSFKTPCVCCGEDDVDCIDFHHVNPEDKKYTMSNLVMGKHIAPDRRPLIMEEASKCVSLCANCHRKFHRGKIKLPDSSGT